MQRKSLPVRSNLEQFRKQAKELVKNHRARDSATLALIREFLPALAGRTDEEIVFFPFALHDAQSVLARQHGFPGWIQLRDEVERIAVGEGGSGPGESVEAKFRTICQAYERNDYALFCSVMNDRRRNGIPEDHFLRVDKMAAVYFKVAYSAQYLGEMSEGEHAIHFWRVSAPGCASDLMVRMGVKDDLVSGLLLSSPFGRAWEKSK